MARRPKNPKASAVIKAMQAVGEDIHQDRFGDEATSYPEFVRMIESRYPVLKQEREWHEWYMTQPYEPRMKLWRIQFIPDRPWASLLLALAFTAVGLWFIKNAIEDGSDYWSTGHPFLAGLQLLILAAWAFIPIGYWRGFIAQAKVHLDPNAPTNGHMAAIKAAQAEADQHDADRPREEGH